MSIYYYLFSTETKECLSLGCREGEEGQKYEGPVIWLGAERFHLPNQLIKLLMDRFYDFHGRDKVVLLSEDELYDSGDYLVEDESCVQIGSDEDNAPPLSKYIPELEEESVRLSIIKDEKLRI